MKPAISSARRGQQTAAARRERGVALVVTLLLLAVITFMAITFLVVSRNERGSVTTTTDLAIARLAAHAALEQAKADIIMPMLAQDNPFLVGLMVSTNYITDGFISGNSHVTNVSYAYQNGQPLSEGDLLQNLANLQFRPRVPVFMRNRQNNESIFQYYLDINRNEMYEPTGWVTNDFNTLDWGNFVGEPEWIGGLEFPDRPHSPDNRFTWRFAYLIAPVGQTLDLNYMHNAAGLPNPVQLAVQDGFIRNQGVGTWELNLAAFLTDLNTNYWYNDYQYVMPRGGINRGAGFDDAAALLRYRYWFDAGSLWTPARLFGVRGDAALANDGYDSYGAGAIMYGIFAYSEDPDRTRAPRNWPGAYNTNLFYSPYDLFDPGKTRIGVGPGLSVTDRLWRAGTNNGSLYNRYTFQRLLEQLGTESAPEENKLNVNYQNLLNGRIIPNLQTNFEPWTPIGLFTNAANRLLDNAGFTFTITNIQIWPTNYYTPSVHRALQLAANLYDATTNTVYPSVFRPLFSKDGNGAIYISGYELMGELDANNQQLRTPSIELEDADHRLRIPLYSDAVPQSREMVYGVPLVIGAKKGLPNFNEYSMQTTMQVTRKLEFLRKDDNQSAITSTNQMYTLSMGTIAGAEVFNSYTNRYPRNLRLSVILQIRPWITNELGKVLYPFGTNNLVYGTTNIHTIPPNTPLPLGLGAFTDATRVGDGSCKVIMSNVFNLMPASTFLQDSQEFTPLTGEFRGSNGTFPVPRWYLNMRTHLVFSLIDTDLNRIIDYVNLSHNDETIDVFARLQQDTPDNDPACAQAFRWVASGSPGSLFCTNRVQDGFATPNILDLRFPTAGILNQIHVSRGNVTSSLWGTATNQVAIDFFKAQFLPGFDVSKTNRFYAPFSPTRNLYLFAKWQANDPLVHYTVGDLVDQGKSRNWGFDPGESTLDDLGIPNRRYEPWNNSVRTAANPKRFDLSLKDPLVRRSDDWDFPTNKFPNIGWIGRVHRGTPWQTVYLKSEQVEGERWKEWAGTEVTFTNHGQVKFSIVASNTVANDSLMSRPFQDWALPDLFTAALVDNATRGQLSINQTNLAAWSAVLSGVPVLSNLTMNAQGQYVAVTNIQPAAVDGTLHHIIDGINRTRGERPGAVFRRLGEICSVPELTVKSPYLSNAGPIGSAADALSDAVYERIPQQIMGLLRCESTPRFVVYSYGQALKPANASVLTTGPLSGMVTNYQVTAEVATRAVIRVEGVPENPKVVVENFNVLPPE